MKYSFCSITYGSGGAWVPAYTLDETIKRVSLIGYDALEVVTASPHAWPYFLGESRRVALKEAFDSARLKVSAVMPYISAGPGCNPATENAKERSWTVEYLKNCAMLAKAWGSEAIGYMAGWTLFGCDKRQAWKNSVESLREVADFAGEMGISVYIQQPLSQSNVVDSPDDALYMLQEVDRANVGLMFDVLSAVNRKLDPADYIYAMGRQLKAIHVCDYGRQAPGTAGLDFKQLYLALREVAYDGFVTVEVDASRSVHADSIARISLEYLKNLEAGL